jgi:hypothetical protein
MTLSGRPLLANASDQALFVGREAETERTERALRQGWNVLLTGERGVGRTTFLNHLARNGADERAPYWMLITPGAGVREPLELIRLILRWLAPAQALTDASTVRDGLDILQRAYEAANTFEGKRLVLVVDDITSEAGNQLFGALRDDMWATNIQWMVSAAIADAPGLLRAPADAFFETKVDLRSFDFAGAVELVRRRVDTIARERLRQIAELADGNPRRLLELVRDSESPDRNGFDSAATGYRQWRIAVNRLDSTMKALYDEVDRLGGASASDPELLERVPLSRPKLFGRLAELAAVGLLVPEKAHDGTPGRPKIVYRPVPPALFESDAIRERAHGNDS